MATAYIHGEEQQWLGENDIYRNELVLWTREVDEAVDGMRNLENLLRGHREHLQAQLEAIALEDQSLQDRQLALAQVSQRGEEKKLLPLIEDHQKDAKRHTERQELRKRLKKRHLSSIACWMRLFKVLTAKS